MTFPNGETPAVGKHTPEQIAEALHLFVTYVVGYQSGEQHNRAMELVEEMGLPLTTGQRRIFDVMKRSLEFGRADVARIEEERRGPPPAPLKPPLRMG